MTHFYSSGKTLKGHHFHSFSKSSGKNAPYAMETHGRDTEYNLDIPSG